MDFECPHHRLSRTPSSTYQISFVTQRCDAFGCVAFPRRIVVKMKPLAEPQGPIAQWTHCIPRLTTSQTVPLCDSQLICALFSRKANNTTHINPKKNNKTAAHQRSMAMTRWYLISAGDFGGFCFFFFVSLFVFLSFGSVYFLLAYSAHMERRPFSVNRQMCSAENVQMKDPKNMSRLLSSVIVAHCRP